MQQLHHVATSEPVRLGCLKHVVEAFHEDQRRPARQGIIGSECAVTVTDGQANPRGPRDGISLRMIRGHIREPLHRLRDLGGWDATSVDGVQQTHHVATSEPVRLGCLKHVVEAFHEDQRRPARQGIIGSECAVTVTDGQANPRGPRDGISLRMIRGHIREPLHRLRGGGTTHQHANSGDDGDGDASNVVTHSVAQYHLPRFRCCSRDGAYRIRCCCGGGSGKQRQSRCVGRSNDAEVSMVEGGDSRRVESFRYHYYRSVHEAETQLDICCHQIRGSLIVRNPEGFDFKSSRGNGG